MDGYGKMQVVPVSIIGTWSSSFAISHWQLPL